MRKAGNESKSSKDKKDAARWRWWRKWWAADDDCEEINRVQGRCRSAADLDVAVDAAIRKEKRRGK